MGATNFLQHNPSAANQETDTTYVTDTTRTGGLLTNQLVPSVWLNKILFQTSTFVAAFAQMMVNKGYTLLDTNLGNLVNALANVLTNNDFKFVRGTNASGAYCYTIDPTGKIDQWGIITNAADGMTVNFGIPFTDVTSISLQTQIQFDPGGPNYAGVSGPYWNTVTVNGFGLANKTLNSASGPNTITIYWRAVGK